jgi:hypothetical protein
MSLRALPMIALPLILYNILVMFSSGDADSFFHTPLLTITMIKGAQWSFSKGDLIVLVTMLCLFVELVKSTYTSTASLVDLGLSMLVFIASLVEFLVVNASPNDAVRNVLGLHLGELRLEFGKLIGLAALGHILAGLSLRLQRPLRAGALEGGKHGHGLLKHGEVLAGLLLIGLEGPGRGKSAGKGLAKARLLFGQCVEADLQITWHQALDAVAVKPDELA